MPSTSERPSTGLSSAPSFPIELIPDVHSLRCGHPPGARPPSPAPAATGMDFLGPTPLAHFCNQRTEPEHAKRTTEPRGEQRFHVLWVPRAVAHSLAASSMGPEPKSRKTPEGIALAGQEPTSQLARSGAEANLREPEHPTRRPFPSMELGGPRGMRKEPRFPAGPVARTTEFLESTEVPSTSRETRRRATSTRPFIPPIGLNGG